jgi:hypothetical protein
MTKLFRIKLEAEEFILAEDETEALEIWSDRLTESGGLTLDRFTSVDLIEEVDAYLEDGGKGNEMRDKEMPK